MKTPIESSDCHSYSDDPLEPPEDLDICESCNAVHDALYDVRKSAEAFYGLLETHVPMNTEGQIALLEVQAALEKAMQSMIRFEEGRSS